jgi:ankyrin repeat protein
VRTIGLLCTLLATFSFACGSLELPRPPGPPADDPRYGEDPFPLDVAIVADDVAAVRTALEAGADANARWSTHGDHFPLQEAIEGRTYHGELTHRAEIVRLLLRHRADPNARWCPFESRGTFAGHTGCRTDSGLTPLMAAAALDQADTTYLLLDAGADPLREGFGAGALEYARGRAVFELLIAAMYDNPATRRARALAYLARDMSRDSRLPQHQTLIARHFLGGGGSPVAVPPPPPPPTPQLARRPLAAPVELDLWARRLDLLLSVGADPNERVSGLWDWTPLAFAINARHAPSVQLLLSYGADPNTRWCTPRAVTPAFACNSARGLTPLMWAAQHGDLDTIRVLLHGGARPEARDDHNRNAVDYAPAASRRAVLDVLAADAGAR